MTGGAGFIGCNLVASYLRDGARVTVLDALTRLGAERNVEWLKGLPGAAERLSLARGDVRDAEAVRAIVGAPGVDAVFHLAAQAAVTTSVLRPREDLEVNLLGTFNVLEAARAAGRPPAVVFTSTNKVYGALERRAVVEAPTRYRFADPKLEASGVDESEPLDFHSPYGCSKGAADQYVRDYARIYGLRTVVLRMSCIYGQRQFGNEDQGWVAHFLIAIATGRPLTIYGDGKQVRDLLHVDDLVAVLRRSRELADAVAGRVYNIGGGPANATSIWAELRPRLERLCGPVREPARAPWRPGDQPVYVSDVTAAARDLAWRPRIGVDEGLARLWSWIQEHRGLFSAPARFAPASAAGG